MQFAISGSSAVKNISLDDDTATVTFSNGRGYDYTVNDVTSFVTGLTRVIESEQSVGRFVNTAIKNEALKAIAA